MIQAFMQDLEREKYSEDNRREMVSVIDLITSTHDVDKNGLDFMELYVASGGRPQDLWAFHLLINSFDYFELLVWVFSRNLPEKLFIFWKS